MTDRIPNSLDTLLGGGVMTGELTELTGAPASGKTQVDHISFQKRDSKTT